MYFSNLTIIFATFSSILWLVVGWGLHFCAGNRHSCKFSHTTKCYLCYKIHIDQGSSQICLNFVGKLHFFLKIKKEKKQFNYGIQKYCISLKSAKTGQTFFSTSGPLNSICSSTLLIIVFYMLISRKKVTPRSLNSLTIRIFGLATLP